VVVQRSMKIALFIDTPTFEYFFRDKLHIDKKQYVNFYQDDWSFLYVKMLKKFNVDITLYAFSLETKKIEVYTHKPTGCKIKFLSVPGIHKLLNKIGSEKSLLHKGFHRYLSSYTSTMSSDLLKSLTCDRPDLIYQQEYESGRFDVLALLAKYLKIPLIAEYHGRDPAFSANLAGFGRFCKKCTIRMARRILCINKNEYRRVKREYALSQDKVVYLPNPVDANFFMQRSKENAKRYLGLDPNKRFILFVGRLVNAHKGITYLIDAFKGVTEIYGDVTLLIVGRGPDEKYLMDYCAIKKIPNIGFKGWIKLRRDLSYFYNASEFLVCPSIDEAFGLVNLEAMASGIPVIGSDVGGIKDIIVNGKTGFLVQPKNSKALYEKMLTLLKDNNLSEFMGKSSRKRVEDYFSCDIIGSNLHNVFEEVLKESD
jgi:glycosyltransferase involved in cell wall biosynthesis